MKRYRALATSQHYASRAAPLAHTLFPLPPFTRRATRLGLRREADQASAVLPAAPAYFCRAVRTATPATKPSWPACLATSSRAIGRGSLWYVTRNSQAELRREGRDAQICFRIVVGTDPRLENGVARFLRAELARTVSEIRSRACSLKIVTTGRAAAFLRRGAGYR